MRIECTGAPVHECTDVFLPGARVHSPPLFKVRQDTSDNTGQKKGGKSPPDQDDIL